MTPRIALYGPLPSAGAIGGVATHTQALQAGLLAAGAAVRVLDDAHAFGLAPEGADGIRGANALVRARLALPPGSRGTSVEELTSLGVSRTTAVTRSRLLARSNREFKPQVLHIQQADFRPLYADAAGIRTPRLITVHGLGALETGEYPGLDRVIPRNLLAADAITTPSHALADEVAALGVPRERITVIPNGVDHARFAPRDRDAARRALGLGNGDIVVFAGRVTAHKGAGDLLEAWTSVRERFPRASLAVVGPAGDVPTADAPGVLTPGPADRETLPLWLCASDLVVVPSRYEGFGLSALEAMACGRPVVATNVGGLPEVVPPQAGRLIPPRDPHAMADAIVALLGDAGAREAASRAALAAAGPYTWDRVAAAFMSTYDTLL